MEIEMEIRVKISNANTLRAHTMVYLGTIYWTGLGQKKAPSSAQFFPSGPINPGRKCAMKCLPQAISLLPRGPQRHQGGQTIIYWHKVQLW